MRSRHLVGDLARAEQRAQQPLGVGVGQPSERHRGDVQSARPPGRPQVEQLGARRADEQDGRVLEPRAQMLEEVEERLGGPVHVLDHEHEQPLAPEEREVGRPRLVERGSRLARPDPRPADRPGSERPIVQPSASVTVARCSVGTVSATARPSFATAASAGSSSRIPASAPATSARGR